MTTKKLLVAYEESKPTAGQGDFLALIFENATPVFFGLRSRRIYKSGRMVFLGKEITEKEIFAKLIDTGRKIESVEDTMANLAAYVQQLGTFRIGNVLSIVAKKGVPGIRTRQDGGNLADVRAEEAPMRRPRDQGKSSPFIGYPPAARLRIDGVDVDPSEVGINVTADTVGTPSLFELEIGCAALLHELQQTGVEIKLPELSAFVQKDLRNYPQQALSGYLGIARGILGSGSPKRRWILFAKSEPAVIHKWLIVRAERVVSSDEQLTIHGVASRIVT
jgi:hypothetical protein